MNTAIQFHWFPLSRIIGHQYFLSAGVAIFLEFAHLHLLTSSPVFWLATSIGRTTSADFALGSTLMVIKTFMLSRAVFSFLVYFFLVILVVAPTISFRVTLHCVVKTCVSMRAFSSSSRSRIC